MKICLFMKNITGSCRMKLPAPRLEGEISLEKAIKDRRTVRAFTAQPLPTTAFSQLLWAAQGITSDRGFYRSAASAGALYPMDLYAVLGKAGVEKLAAGVYHYEPRDHSVSLIVQGDLRAELARSSLSQMWMARAPLTLVITAEYNRIRVKYGERGVRYALFEAGHIAQNIFLQAEALGLGAGIVGAFRDNEVSHVLKIPQAHEPLLLMPVGYKAGLSS